MTKRRRKHVQRFAAGWCIVTKAGKRYVPRAFPSETEARLALQDLLLPYPPNSAWRTLSVALRGAEPPVLMWMPPRTP